MCHRARQSGWVDALHEYRQTQPQSADTAAALAVVEGLDRDTGYNLSNQITYAAPSPDRHLTGRRVFTPPRQDERTLAAAGGLLA